MFDKQKIIRMTTELENFVRTFPNIYILPEVFSSNIFSLLKRLNAKVAAIITNNPQPNVIHMPSGEYQLTNLQAALPHFQQKTGMIISATKPAENPITPFRFNIGNIKIVLPAFTLTDEEALAIYDRLMTIHMMRQYQNDGISTNVKDIPIRFARGMSTFIDSQFQDVKVQFWDRREFKIPSYDEVDDAAIVMQGPLEYRDNYTITTARLYRQWYPNAPIVISTWKNEATENFREECRKIGVVLLENNLPDEPGALHVNYQLESSFKGVEYVKNNTLAKFALKCRTDQRINRTDFLLYLTNLLDIFPANGDKLNKRIIIFGADKWIPFYTSDFFYFGNVDDAFKMFNIPRQTKEAGKKFMRLEKRLHYIRRKLLPFIFFRNLEIKNSRKLRNYNIMIDKFEFAEVFILKYFYHYNIAPIQPSKLLQTYWKFIRDYSIVIDLPAFIRDWPKYQHSANYAVIPYYDRGLDFARWLDIYLNYKDEDEI